jgi:membrane protein DedA with SNARE-associated domain
VSTWIEQAVAHIGDWPPLLAYGALVLSAFLENVLPPVPGDLVVVLSAYLAGRGVLDWLLVYLCTCLGGTGGFLLMYYLGRTRGRSFLRGRAGGMIMSSSASLERVESWLSRYGVWLVLGNRFLSGIRSVIALAAGMGGMNWRPVAILGGVSMLLWNGVLLCAGWKVGQNWEDVTYWLSRYNRVIGGLLAVLALSVAWRWWRRRSTEGSSVDSPSEGT